jgi:hypothetical protein
MLTLSGDVVPLVLDGTAGIRESFADTVDSATKRASLKKHPVA